MEVRYIVFSPEEARAAMISLAQKRGVAAAASDIVAVDFVPPNDAPSALLRLQGTAAEEPTALSAQSIVAGLLLYCGDRRIPTRATNDLTNLRQELSRAQTRASYAEGLVAEADERAQRAETARSKATSALVSIANLPGVRGRLGRWLVRYRPP